MSEGEAGHELDALVAEKVMGWVFEERPGGDDHWRKPDGRMVSVHGWKWLPSTDIVAAWTVIEHLNSLGNTVEIKAYNNGECNVEVWIGGAYLCGIGANTAPLAICRAALKARGW